MTFTKKEKLVLFEQIYDIKIALKEKMGLRLGSISEIDDVVVKLGGRSRYEH